MTHALKEVKGQNPVLAVYRANERKSTGGYATDFDIVYGPSADGEKAGEEEEKPNPFRC